MLKENSSITVTISRDFECKHFILFYFLILLDQPASWWETILMFVFVCFFVISFDLSSPSFSSGRAGLFSPSSRRWARNARSTTAKTT